VGQLIRWFTFMGREEVEALEARHKAAPQERAAQKALADAVTDLVHGTSETARAKAAAAALFSGDVRGLDAALLRDIASDLPSSEVPAAQLAGEGLALVDLLPTTSLAASKREAREFLGAGAVSVNGEKAAAEARLTSANLLHGEIALLRRGKKLWHVVRAARG
jgi:tyrosyl-tRNA synthetase